MTTETQSKLQRAFREDLLALARRTDQLTLEAGLDSRTSSWIVCEECMQLAAYFAAHAGVDGEKFAEESANKLKWHKDHPPPEMRPPTTSLN